MSQYDDLREAEAALKTLKAKYDASGLKRSKKEAREALSKEGQKQLKKYEMIESGKSFDWFIYPFMIVGVGLLALGQGFMFTLCYDIIESICGIESDFLAYILMLVMIGLYIFLGAFIFEASSKVQKKKILEIPEIKKYFHDSAAALEFESQIDECEKGIARIRNAIEEQEKEKRLEIRTEKFNRVMDKVFGSSSGSSSASSSGSGGYTHWLMDHGNYGYGECKLRKVGCETLILSRDRCSEVFEKYVDNHGHNWYTNNRGVTFFRAEQYGQPSWDTKIVVCNGNSI